MSVTPSMLFDFGVSLVNFFIMYQLFRIVVVEAMVTEVKRREKVVSDKLVEIDEARAEAQAMQEKYEQRMAKLDDELAEIQASAQNTIRRSKSKIEEQAEREASYILDKANRESDHMEYLLRKELQEKVAREAVAKARDLLAEAADKKTQDKFLTFAVDKVGELSAS